MEIKIRITGPSADTELSSLYTWLCDEQDVRQYAQITLLTAEPGPADMGSAFEVIQLIVDSGFQAANLGLAYEAWRATRRNSPQVTIERDGITVTLDGQEADSTKAIIEILKK